MDPTTGIPSMKVHHDGTNGYSYNEYPDFLILSDRKIKCKNLGEKFASINAHFLDYLKEYNIPTSFIRCDGKSTLKFHKTIRFPFSIRILNTADKRTAKIIGIKEHSHLALPIFEPLFHNIKGNILTESHLMAFDLCTVEEFKLMNRTCSKVNAVLKSFFERRNTSLSEVTCFFGKADEKVYLEDDFTPKSLKVVSVNPSDILTPDPYKFGTSTEVRQYTDYFHHIMSA